MNAAEVLFYVFGGLAILGAVGMLANFRNTVNAALSLLVSLLAIAGLFIQLQAEFIGALQVLVYGGAIVVLFVFVIMLLNLRGGAMGGPRQVLLKSLGVIFLAAAAIQVAAVLGTGAAPPAPVGASFGSVESVAAVLYTDYLLAFEAAGVLLLAGIVGAVVLAKRELD